MHLLQMLKVFSFSEDTVASHWTEDKSQYWRVVKTRLEASLNPLHSLWSHMSIFTLLIGTTVTKEDQWDRRSSTAQDQLFSVLLIKLYFLLYKGVGALFYVIHSHKIRFLPLRHHQKTFPTLPIQFKLQTTRDHR